MKYINHETRGIIIFDGTNTHSDIAKLIGGNILSAGFVNIETGKCYGESLSLNLPSLKYDTVALRAAMSV